MDDVARDIMVVEGLKQRWEPVTVSVTDFLKEQQQRWGQNSYCKFEYLTWGTQIRPYFDYDATMDAEPVNVGAHRTKCLDAVTEIFAADPNFDVLKQVVIGHRHGWLPTGKYKVSFRLFVSGYSILLEDMPKLIKECSADEGHPWDIGVYHRQQKMGVPGACKSPQDPRTLELEDQSQAAQCIIQNLCGDERALQGFQDDQHVYSSLTVTPSRWSIFLPHLVKAGFRDPVPIATRPHSITFQAANKGMDCPCCDNVHDSNGWFVMEEADGSLKVKNYSTRCRVRMLNRSVSIVEEIITTDNHDTTQMALQKFGLTSAPHASKDSLNRDCLAVEQHLENCPLCQLKHNNPTWYIYPLVNACCSMRNADMDCTERLLHSEMLNKHLRSIALNPSADQDYVNLFLSELKDPIISNGTVVYKFDGITWVEWTDSSMKTDMQTWLKETLERLFWLVCKETALGVKNPFENSKGVYKSVVKAIHHVSLEGSVNNFIKSVKRAKNVYDAHLDDSLDKNPYLLGCSSGIVDLQSCEFRPARPEDRVTMSVGYAFQETVDPVVEAEVIDFLGSVYPVEAERDLMQRWCGYCLLGHTNEKFFLLLTDVRDGFNAKSTILRLLAATMGDYACKPDPAILYKEDRPRGANEHSAAIMALKKRRVAYVEETDSARVLAEETIKDWTGGGTRITARGCGSAKVEEFDFVTKLIVSFNQGKCFHFSTEDSALLSRMLTIPHRSRFYLDEVPDEPYSYKADPNLRQRFDEWRPYFLRWCLDGLKQYNEKGFRDIPTSCQAFKDDLVAEKNVIAEFLKDAVEPAGDKDFVHVKELYNAFDDAYRTLQKDKKTKKSLQVFKAGVAKTMPKCYKDKYSFRTSAGRVTSVNSVLLGLKRKTDVSM